jgi:hypothetical protein
VAQPNIAATEENEDRSERILFRVGLHQGVGPIPFGLLLGDWPCARCFTCINLITLALQNLLLMYVIGVQEIYVAKRPFM